MLVKFPSIEQYRHSVKELSERSLDHVQLYKDPIYRDWETLSIPYTVFDWCFFPSKAGMYPTAIALPIRFTMGTCPPPVPIDDVKVVDIPSFLID